MYPYSLHCLSKAKAKALSLQEVKKFLKITHDEEDDLLSNLITAVTAKCERYTAQALIFQTWQASYRQFARLSLTMPIKPAQKVISIRLFKNNGEEQIFAAAHYQLVSEENELYFNSFPICYYFRIEYLAGYGYSAQDVPEDLKVIMLSHLAFLYQHREGEYQFPMSRYDEFKTMRI